MRKPIIAGNWKMFKTIKEAKELVCELKNLLREEERVEVVVCPPFTALSEVGKETANSNIILGAQNMHFAKEGAFTGEVSPLMLKEIGCKYVIIGHSERRQYFGEQNELINQKIKSALSFELIPILCVGEKLEERKKEKTFDIVSHQVIEGLKGIEKEYIKNIVLAYEPVWAIGTGVHSTPEDAQKVIKFIRKSLEEMYDQQCAESVRIQYGGSVKPDNISSFMQMPDIDGALVGGASLQPQSFAQIVRYKEG